MAKCNVYSVFDRKTEAYGLPFGALNDGVACRSITNSLIDRPTSYEARYPRDFELVNVGEFDDSRGVLVPREHGFVHVAEFWDLDPSHRTDDQPF